MHIPTLGARAKFGILIKRGLKVYRYPNPKHLVKPRPIIQRRDCIHMEAAKLRWQGPPLGPRERKLWSIRPENLNRTRKERIQSIWHSQTLRPKQHKVSSRMSEKNGWCRKIYLFPPFVKSLVLDLYQFYFTRAAQKWVRFIIGTSDQTHLKSAGGLTFTSITTKYETMNSSSAFVCGYLQLRAVYIINVGHPYRMPTKFYACT